MAYTAVELSLVMLRINGSAKQDPSNIFRRLVLPLARKSKALHITVSPRSCLFGFSNSNQALFFAARIKDALKCSNGKEVIKEFEFYISATRGMLKANSTCLSGSCLDLLEQLSEITPAYNIFITEAIYTDCQQPLPVQEVGWKAFTGAENQVLVLSLLDSPLESLAPQAAKEPLLEKQAICQGILGACFIFAVLYASGLAISKLQGNSNQEPVNAPILLQRGYMPLQKPSASSIDQVASGKKFLELVPLTEVRDNKGKPQ